MHICVFVSFSRTEGAISWWLSAEDWPGFEFQLCHLLDWWPSGVILSKTSHSIGIVPPTSWAVVTIKRSAHSSWSTIPSSTKARRKGDFPRGGSLGIRRQWGEKRPHSRALLSSTMKERDRTEELGKKMKKDYQSSRRIRSEWCHRSKRKGNFKGRFRSLYTDMLILKNKRLQN